MDRSKLPFREKAEAFLVYKNRILCLDKSAYIQLPGGGIDPGESPEAALKREIKEETGCSVTGLKYIITADAIWSPAWTEGKPKREARYKEFQGERTHIFIGFVNKCGKPTSKEGDEWPQPTIKNSLSIDKLAKRLTDIIPNQTKDFQAYATAQASIVNTLRALKVNYK